MLQRDGTAADAWCGTALPYACFRKKTPDLVMNSCGTFDNGNSIRIIKRYPVGAIAVCERYAPPAPGRHPGRYSCRYIYLQCTCS